MFWNIFIRFISHNHWNSSVSLNFLPVKHRLILTKHSMLIKIPWIISGKENWICNSVCSMKDHVLILDFWKKKRFKWMCFEPMMFPKYLWFEQKWFNVGTSWYTMIFLKAICLLVLIHLYHVLVSSQLLTKVTNQLLCCHKTEIEKRIVSLSCYIIIQAVSAFHITSS